MAPSCELLSWSVIILFLILNLIGNSYCQLFNLLRGKQSNRNTLKENGFSRTCVHDLPKPVYFDDENAYLHCFEQTAKQQQQRHPDQGLRLNALAIKYGYNLVTYNDVITKDDYTISIFRISGSPQSPPRKGKKAILMLHGMGTASDYFILQNDQRKNLAMKLVNELEMDVFFINFRGTDYSKRHKTLNPDSDIKYWDFSFHEMGIYDFPAAMNLILSETLNDKIFVTCHSMGCAALTIGLSEQPDLNDKIEASIFLAPAIYIGHMYNPFRFFTAIVELGPVIQSWLNLAVRGRIESGIPFQNLIQTFCTPTALRCGVCGISLFYMHGYNAAQMNYTNIPNIISKVSNTQSFKTLIHLGQNFKSCLFRKYDYGEKENFRRYRQTEPPEYDLSNLRVPIHIYYADGDNFVPPVDAMQIRNALPPGIVKSFNNVPWKLFTHLDFVIAENADILVYNNVLNVLRNYTFSNNK